MGISDWFPYYLGRTDVSRKLVLEACKQHANYYHGEGDSHILTWDYDPHHIGLELEEYQDNDNHKMGPMWVYVRYDAYEFDDKLPNARPLFDTKAGESIDRWGLPGLGSQYEVDNDRREVFATIVERLSKKLGGRERLIDI